MVTVDQPALTHVMRAAGVLCPPPDGTAEPGAETNATRALLPGWPAMARNGLRTWVWIAAISFASVSISPAPAPNTRDDRSTVL